MGEELSSPIFIFLGIFINIKLKIMMYKQKIELLLEKLESKLRILENVSNGSMRVSQSDVNTVISDCKRVKEQISELISLER